MMNSGNSFFLLAKQDKLNWESQNTTRYTYIYIYPRTLSEFTSVK
jgi:hypothetical protein